MESWRLEGLEGAGVALRVGERWGLIVDGAGVTVALPGLLIHWRLWTQGCALG